MVITTEKEFFEKFEEFHKQLNVLLEAAGSLAPIWEQQYLEAQFAMEYDKRYKAIFL